MKCGCLCVCVWCVCARESSPNRQTHHRSNSGTRTLSFTTHYTPTAAHAQPQISRYGTHHSCTHAVTTVHEYPIPHTEHHSMPTTKAPYEYHRPRMITRAPLRTHRADMHRADMHQPAAAFRSHLISFRKFLGGWEVGWVPYEDNLPAAAHEGFPTGSFAPREY
jgi:hypothetical protein